MASVAETLQIATPSAHAIAFWLVAGIGMVLGPLVAVMLRRPDLRRAGVGGTRVFSWPATLAAALLVTGTLVGSAYVRHWTVFFAIQLGRDALVLTYHHPERRVDVPRDRLVEIGQHITGDKGERAFALVLICADGERLESAPLRLEACNALTQELRAWLRSPTPR